MISGFESEFGSHMKNATSASPSRNSRRASSARRGFQLGCFSSYHPVSWTDCLVISPRLFARQHGAANRAVSRQARPCEWRRMSASIREKGPGDRILCGCVRPTSQSPRVVIDYRSEHEITNLPPTEPVEILKRSLRGERMVAISDGFEVSSKCCVRSRTAILPRCSACARFRASERLDRRPRPDVPSSKHRLIPQPPLTRGYGNRTLGMGILRLAWPWRTRAANVIGCVLPMVAGPGRLTAEPCANQIRSFFRLFIRARRRDH